MAEPLSLRLYLAAAHLIPLAAPFVLRGRLARGREDAARWREKLGEPSAARPAGRLVWLHAVGIGEVMALRGLVGAMAARDADLQFLVTSSARSSAQVFAGNLPERTIHQYLPLDAPHYLARFLDHWRPHLSVWAEQDLWPGAVVAADRRGVPLALVNARMNERSFLNRRRFKRLYSDLHARFQLVAAQDDATAGHLRALGARDVRVTGSLKSAAPPLSADAAELARLRAALAGRRLWVAASTHAEDEAVALAAQAALWRQSHDWLMILAPRVPGRQVAMDLPHARRSTGEVAGPDHAVWLADTFGELGLWYRLAPVALMGGTFGPVEGHNPWEPASLGVAVLHGPHFANFRNDYKALQDADAARQIAGADLAAALSGIGTADMGARGKALAMAARDGLDPLARDLLGLMDG
ncbi:MAG: 3-deoxy-D-manno-octulosonic acid transferase [Pseudorhodobacter sp.]